MSRVIALAGLKLPFFNSQNGNISSFISGQNVLLKGSHFSEKWANRGLEVDFDRSDTEK